MKWQRRDFLRGLTAGSAINLLRAAEAFAASTAPTESLLSNNTLLIDVRGRLQPIGPGSLPVHASRTVAGQTEHLQLTNFYFERGIGKEQAVAPVLPVCGEFHFARSHPGSWQSGLSKMKACGLTAVSTYLFWILHEWEEGTFDWQGRRDLHRFLELCAQQNLDVYLRVGPYVHGEMRNGGLPDWMYGKPFEVRSNDPAYLACVRRYFDEIGRQLRGFLWSEGGPVMGIQLENEFMAASSPWEAAATRQQPIVWMPKGSGGMEHMMALKKIALDAGLVAPLYTATAWGSPVPTGQFLPLHGGYGFEPWSIDPATQAQKPSWTFLFHNAHGSVPANGKPTAESEAGQVPFACCELGGGMQCFYRQRFVVPADSVQATAITALGSGSAFLGYYMFHGGSNPTGEAVTYGEYDVPRISYDFQAPIREFGQMAESYRALRALHMFVNTWGSKLAALQTVLPANAEKLLPDERAAVRYAVRTDGEQSFLFVNNYQDHVAQPARRGLRFHIQLEGSAQVVPSQAGLALAAGESAVLPVGLRLGKVIVAWSTAQLLTEIEHEHVRDVFLFAPRGVEPEIALDANGLDTCRAAGCELRREAQRWIARGAADSAFCVECKAGAEAVQLHVLPRGIALSIARLHLAGKDRLVLSDSDAVELHGALELWSRTEQVEAFVFPPLPGTAPVAQSVFPAASRLHADLPRWKGGVQFDCVAGNELRIHLEAGTLHGAENILLRISYVGDVGQMFLRGTLVADHFANGETWEVGLRQLMENNEAAELVVKILPREAESNVHLDETVPGRERFAGASVAILEKFEAVPIYRFAFNGQESA
jgi:hypothetical protein